MINLEMVEIPAGWGCESFRIGRHPITVGEWNAVMPDDPRGGDNRHPVTKVNIEDINKFIAKLNAATGENYRLPTENEWCAATGKEPGDLWEYAVFWADSIAIVESKKPNEHGVYDMQGNVWEWATTGRQNKQYILRGGSWSDLLRGARAGDRFAVNHLAIRYFDVGFRVAAGGFHAVAIAANHGRRGR